MKDIYCYTDEELEDKYKELEEKGGLVCVQ